MRIRTTWAGRLLAGGIVVGGWLAGHAVTARWSTAPARWSSSSWSRGTPPPTTGLSSALADQTGFRRSWRLIAYALCRDPLPGQQITANSLRASSDPVQSQLALCPAGQSQIGYGGRVDNGAGQVHVTELFDFFGPPVGVTFLRAREDADGYAGSWGLTPSAVCVDAAAATGFVSVAAVSPSTSQNKAVSVSCPAGTQVHSAGGALLSGSVQLATGSLIIDQIAVDPSATSVTVRGVEDENGTTDPWMVRAVALCGP